MKNELTTDQQAAAEIFERFFHDPKEKYMNLTGGPGVGKTFLVQHLIRALGSGYSVAITAPTNKATQVVRSMAEEAGVNYDDARTIHSLLSLRLSNDGEVKQIRQGNAPDVGQYDLVVCDEASMINHHLMDFIDKEARLANTKWLFVGDAMQLPPVGYQTSAVLSMDMKYEAELTKIVRQAEGNPILTFLATVRHAVEEGNPSLIDWTTRKNPDTGHGVFVMQGGAGNQKFNQWINAGFKSTTYANNGDYLRVVAYRNARVHEYNKQIRAILYGERASQPVIVTERVLTASPVKDYEEHDTPVLVPVDSEGTVMSVQVGEHPVAETQGYPGLTAYCLKVAFEDYGLVDAWLPHPDSERAVRDIQNDLAKKAKDRSSRIRWPDFWQFKEMWNDIRPAHAITSHRSQGSTYDNVFVDYRDISTNRDTREMLKSLYVACSRARSNVVILI